MLPIKFDEPPACQARRDKVPDAVNKAHKLLQSFVTKIQLGIPKPPFFAFCLSPVQLDYLRGIPPCRACFIQLANLPFSTLLLRIINGYSIQRHTIPAHVGDPEHTTMYHFS